MPKEADTSMNEQGLAAWSSYIPLSRLVPTLVKASYSPRWVFPSFPPPRLLANLGSAACHLALHQRLATSFICTSSGSLWSNLKHTWGLFRSSVVPSHWRCYRMFLIAEILYTLIFSSCPSAYIRDIYQAAFKYLKLSVSL